jgi:hypothetical protein
MGTTIAVIVTSNRDEPGAEREGSGDEYSGDEGRHEDDSDRQGFNSRTPPSPKASAWPLRRSAEPSGLGNSPRSGLTSDPNNDGDSAPQEPSSSEVDMRAVAVFPASREVKVIDHKDPRISQPDQVKLRILDVGICGTDKEICSFEYGTSHQEITTW